MNHLIDMERLEPGIDNVAFFSLPFGLKPSVKCLAYRGPDPMRWSEGQGQFAIFSNGGADTPVRVAMKPATPCKFVNWAVHRNEVAFRWAILPPGPYEDGNAWSREWGGGGVGYTLRFGQNFHRDNRQVFNAKTQAWGVEADMVRLVFADKDQAILHLTRITEAVDGSILRDNFELPVAKFVEDYSPFKSHEFNAEIQWKLESTLALKEGMNAPIFAPEPPPLKPALSMCTLLKIKSRFLPLLERARHAVNKPGGSGFKRARASFEQCVAKEPVV